MEYWSSNVIHLIKCMWSSQHLLLHIQQGNTKVTSVTTDICDWIFENQLLHMSQMIKSIFNFYVIVTLVHYSQTLLLYIYTVDGQDCFMAFVNAFKLQGCISEPV